MPAEGTRRLENPPGGLLSKQCDFPHRNTRLEKREEELTAIALAIAGSDSGGGAGIQADLKTFSALGVYGASIITAVTAQNTCAVLGVEPISAHMVRLQIQAVLDDLPVGAIKIGMLASVEIIDAVTEALSGTAIPVVIDPVMIAKSGDTLLAEQAIVRLRSRLLPLATLLTPNLPEAARLLDTSPAVEPGEMAIQGQRLRALGPQAVLMKGGHLASRQCTDILVERTDMRRWQAPRLDTRNTHGTGCSFSAAIAAFLAKGHSLCEAVSAAHGWLQEAIRAADKLEIGSGHGPVHHFHALWREGQDMPVHSKGEFS